MREIFNFLNFGKRKKKKKKEKRNIEVSKIFNFGNLKKRNIEVSKIFNFGNLKKLKSLKVSNLDISGFKTLKLRIEARSFLVKNTKIN